MYWTQRTRRLLEKARWKQSDWDKPTPIEVLEEYANASSLHGVHMSEVGPGGEATTPAELADGDGEVAYTDPQPVGGFKVGINPETDFNTPAGVYAYPLTPETYDMWFGDVDRLGHPNMFGFDRPWMYVLESRADAMTIREDGTSPDVGQGGLRDGAVAVARAFPGLVEDAAASYGVSRLEPVPDTFDPDRPESVLDTVLFDKAVRDAKIDSHAAELWNFTRVVAHRSSAGRSTVTWNKILREALDVRAVWDQGSGLVYNAEPKQIVFLEPTAYDEAAAVPNVWTWSRKRDERKRERDTYEALEAAGLGHLASKVTFGEYTDEHIETIVDTIVSSPPLKRLLERAEPRSGRDNLEIQNIRGSEGIDVSYLSLEGMNIGPKLAAMESTISLSQLRRCTWTSDYAERMVNKSGAMWREVELVDCDLEASIDTLARAQGIDPDSVEDMAEKVRRVVERPKTMISATYAEQAINDMWGIWLGATHTAQQAFQGECEVHIR